jgi:Peptidase A4 family
VLGVDPNDVGLTRSVLLTGLCAAILAGPALATGTSASDETVTALGTGNWGGYVLTGASQAASPLSFTHVTGTWKVPAVDCTVGSSDSAAAVAVGLGGFSSPLFEQIGTAANCDASGPASYYGWYSLDWGPTLSFVMRVDPGDVMTANVTVSNTNLVTMTLQNLTRHSKATVKKLAGAVDVMSAEWLADQMGSCGCAMPLADFNSLGLSKLSATDANGTTGGLTQTAWTVNPVQVGTNTEKYPGTCPPENVAADGKSFTLSWVQDAVIDC